MKVLFVAGPTASGKSDLALHLAEKFQGQIVNCDSIQCYSEINLGSAKPSKEELVRVPHHLFDFVNSPEEITAGRYFELAESKLADMASRKVQLAIVVGGTGFYLQALEKGMYSTGPVNSEILKKIEAQLADGQAEQLWRELNAVDPETAVKISINDHYRLGRAMEIYRGHKRIPSEVRKEFRESQRLFPYPLMKLRLRCERSWLADRIAKRIHQWMQQGWVDEVRDLLDQGLENWAPLASVGFLEVKQSLLAATGFKQSELEALICTRTLQLAKKQRTWFQRDPEMHVLMAEELQREGQKAEKLVNSWLSAYD
jgi:tRNA dimethylallyltransferase